MGNGTKVALVALLILMVVVIARFVRDDSAPAENSAVVRAGVSPTGPSKAGARKEVATQPKGKRPSLVRKAAAPSRTPPGSGARETPQASRTSPAGSAARRKFSNPPSTSEALSPAGGSPASAEGTPSPGRIPPAVGRHALPRPEGLFSPGNESSPAVAAPAGSTAGTPSTPGPEPAVGRGVPPVSVTAGGPAARVGQDPRQDVTAPGSPGGTQRPPEAEKPSSGEPAVASPGGASPAGGAPPASQPAPGGEAKPDRGVEGFPKTHEIQKGDTLWGLAMRFYGSGSEALIQHIRNANPKVKMHPGNKLTLPAPPEGFRVAGVASEARLRNSAFSSSRQEDRSARATSLARQPRTSAGQTSTQDYVVQKGDTLMKIAKKFYGDSTMFHLIEDANEDLKYQVLRAGAKIRIPPKR